MIVDSGSSEEKSVVVGDAGGSVLYTSSAATTIHER